MERILHNQFWEGVLEVKCLNHSRNKPYETLKLGVSYIKVIVVTHMLMA